jgi:6-pyruvoyltetrahydropterin/6-carboxytetrahydropterin synthase
MYYVTLTERFTATHSLDTLRPQPHSHDWVVRVTLGSDTLAEPGIVFNYFDLVPRVRKLLPHDKDLNACYDFAPTGENLARHFYDTLKPQLPQLVQVAVGEFEDFMCTYAPEGLVPHGRPGG